MLRIWCHLRFQQDLSTLPASSILPLGGGRNLFADRLCGCWSTSSQAWLSLVFGILGVCPCCQGVLNRVCLSRRLYRVRGYHRHRWPLCVLCLLLFLGYQVLIAYLHKWNTRPVTLAWGYVVRRSLGIYMNEQVRSVNYHSLSIKCLRVFHALTSVNKHIHLGTFQPLMYHRELLNTYLPENAFFFCCSLEVLAAVYISFKCGHE